MKSPILESYHYKPSFGKLFQQLFEDNAISDSTLRDEACELLTVLDRPEMADYNFPSWITCHTDRHWPDRTFGITMKRVVEALYLTAEEFNMSNSARFISACICAEGRLVRDECESDADADLEAETMAAVLAGLAADWFMDILNPFLSVELMYGKTVPPFQALKEKLVERDGYSCVFCGGIFGGKSESQCTLQGRIVDEDDLISPARIFYHTVSEHPTTPTCKPFQGTVENESIRLRALETLRYYCGFPEDETVHPFSPRNCMLMHSRSAWAFASLLWCLKPTQTPNRYDVVVFAPNEVGGDPVDWVHFYDIRTGDPVNDPVAPPDPHILRVHAMAATLLHHSGATGLFRFPYVPQTKPRRVTRPACNSVEQKGPINNIVEDKPVRRHRRSFLRRVLKSFLDHPGRTLMRLAGGPCSPLLSSAR